MESDERKLTLYTNGEKVREMMIQHGKKEDPVSLNEPSYRMKLRDYERLILKNKIFDPSS